MFCHMSDLVPRSRFGSSRTKKQGRGRERRKRDLAKYDCVGQNLAHASTVHALNLTCFHAVQFRHWVGYCVAFCFKKHSSLNLKPKTQALKCFEGCSAAAGQHVLAVLTTGYGKNWADLRAVAAKHVGNRNVSVFWGGRAGSITIVVLPLSAPALQISGLNKSEAGPLLFLLQCETWAKEQKKTWLFWRHGQGQCLLHWDYLSSWCRTCKHLLCHPEVM